MTGGSPDAQVETRPTNLHVVPDEISAMTPDRSDVPTEADNQGCVYMDAETDPSTPQGGTPDSMMQILSMTLAQIAIAKTKHRNRLCLRLQRSVELQLVR